MDYQEWEFFEAEVNHEGYALVDPGPLFQPVTAFTIKRDKRLHLLIETTSAVDSSSSARPPVANTVYQPDGQVQFTHRFTGATFTLKGISPAGYTSNHGAATPANPSGGTKVQTSTYQSLHWSSGRSESAKYLVEWIENLSDRFMWPHFDEVEETTTRSRSLKSGTDCVVIPWTTKSENHSRTCARLQIGGWDVIIGQARVKREHVKAPGFILYMAIPDEDVRSRIRDCLSYCLGDYLIYLGSTTFDSSWNPVSFFARAGHALVEQAPAISGRPPSPLGTRYEREVDPEVLSRMASALLSIYEPYKLRSTFWNFWHAAAAPVHMAAAHYGAAIEALQRTYFDSTASKANPLIATKEDWRDLYSQIDRCIQDSALKPEDKAMLSNKAKGLNFAPQATQAERFFSALGLTISELEKVVWTHRNRAAHGSGIAEDRVIQTIRENKILMMLMNRILLAISGASALYYDHYTLGGPTRPLSQPIPDDRAIA